jgi:hypothetical protein
VENFARIVSDASRACDWKKAAVSHVGPGNWPDSARKTEKVADTWGTVDMR